MASVIKAGNATDGVQVTSDNTGILELKTGTGSGTTAMTVGTGQNVTFAQAANLPNTFGFKNRIINGNMVIDQRNAGASVTQTTGELFPVDRWIVSGSVTSKFTAQRNAGSVTPPAGYTNYLGITSSAATSLAAGDYYLIYQRIEGFNVADLGWGTSGAVPVTLSFWVRSSLTGTFGGAINNSGATRSYPFSYTISSANTWEQKTIVILGDTTGTWLTTNGTGIALVIGLGSGSTYSGTAGVWAGANFQTVTGAVSVVGTNGATFYITGVQLEKGSTATSFDVRPYTTELQLCQRYLFCYRSSSTAEYVTLGHAATTSFAVHNFAFPVAVRVPPTGVTVSSASHFYALNGTTSVAPGAATSIVIESGSTISGQVKTTVASGLTAGQGSYLYTQSASAVLFFTGCEL